MEYPIKIDLKDKVAVVTGAGGTASAQPAVPPASACPTLRAKE